MSMNFNIKNKNINIKNNNLYQGNINNNKINISNTNTNYYNNSSTHNNYSNNQNYDIQTPDFSQNINQDEEKVSQLSKQITGIGKSIIDIINIQSIQISEDIMKEATFKKYGISKENIEKEINLFNGFSVILKDGRKITFNKTQDNIFELYRIDTLDENERITSSTIYNTETGKESLILDYEYNQDGSLYRVKETNLISNKITYKYYKNEKEYTDLSDLIYKSGNLTYEDVKDYYFNYSDTTRLAEPLSNILTPKEINEINIKINQAVEYAGPGTGKGAAAAAITLITELKKRGIVLPYYYGGGHSDRTTGIDPNWGTTVSKTAAGTEYREKKSMDCSGFVCWAMSTAGIDETPKGASGYYSAGNKISFNDATPGDLLVKSDHVILVIDSYTDDLGKIHLICAESTGDFATEAIYDSTNYNNVKPDYEGGIIIRDYTESSASKYSVIDMDQYYENKAN